MKGLFVCLTAIVTILACFQLSAAQDQTQTFPTENNFYSNSLHYTNRGIEYLYSKEHGGIERLTGISAVELGCVKAECHVKTCDNCHATEVKGKAAYTVAQARTEQACIKCHEPDPKVPDVHTEKGMKCMQCHTSREIHGDGKPHNTYMEAGFFDVRCENCHSNISKIAAHTVHNGKLDCAACHVAAMSACHNCHLDSKLKDKKSPSQKLELKNLYFLINHDGKVQLANYLSYVYGNKTMITLAPFFPHSIKKQGRACGECHNSRIVNEIDKQKFKPFTWLNGQLINQEGIVPVLDGMKWDLIFFTRENGNWVLLKNAEPPIVKFSGASTPLTKEQFQLLLAPQQGK